MCLHLEWGWDDRGNHWCSDCRLWHDFPHEPGQDPALCAESAGTHADKELTWTNTQAKTRS